MARTPGDRTGRPATQHPLDSPAAPVAGQDAPSRQNGTYTTAEVLALLRISENHLRALMRDPDHEPPFRELKLGAAVRYPKAEVDAYLGRDRDGEAARRDRLLARGEALLGAVGQALAASGAAQAGLAALQGEVAALLAELTTPRIAAPGGSSPGADTPTSIRAAGRPGTERRGSGTDGQVRGRSVPGAPARAGRGRAAGAVGGGAGAGLQTAGRAGGAGAPARVGAAGVGRPARRGVGGDRAALRPLRGGDHPPPGD